MIDAGALIPQQQLEAGSIPGEWVATGDAPFFVWRGSLPAGVLAFRLVMESEVRGRGEVGMDSGSGYSARETVRLPEIHRKLSLDTYIHLKRPVREIRFQPIDKAGRFVIKAFELKPLSGSALFLRSVKSKWREIQVRNRLGPAFKKGVKLLLKGDFSALKGKVVQSLGSAADTTPEDYLKWRAHHALTDAKRAQMKAATAAMKDPPYFSILTPVYNAPEIYLRKCFDSVLNQIYPHWQLCLADDCSTQPHVRPLLEEYAKKDPRISVIFREKNGNISAATNSALTLAKHPYLALLDNDDEIAEHALFRMAEAIQNNPDADMLYSDEDMLDMKGVHIHPFFKPDWSPEYFLACMYTCHLGVYRTELIRDIGGFRSAYDSAQDYDLVLRVMQRTQMIVHVPDILYHWRQLPTSTASGASAKPKAHITAQNALKDYVRACGRGGTVEDGPAAGFHRVRYEIKATPKVSIVIPSACRLVKIKEKESYYALHCIQSILEKSSYKNLEIVVLDRNQMPAELQAKLETLGVKRVAYDEPFNWSRVNNLGARKTSGEQLLFLNDDMEVISPDWLEAMLEFAQVPEIGAVGAKLFFEDGTLQHAGVAIIDGKPGHPYYAIDGAHLGYFMSNVVHRDVCTVTGACLMTRRDVFGAVGGFTEEFPLNYNDVDYCLKLLEAKKRVVFTPYAQLTHYESVTRAKNANTSAELARFHAIWKEKFPRDPYYNSNLNADYRISMDEIV